MSTTSVTKIGPYGGSGGNAWDIYTQPKALQSVQVWSNDVKTGGVIYGLSFTYIDKDGKPTHSGRWGSNAGKHHVINLAEDEHIISIYGTTDGYGITSLTFQTDRKDDPYGPYGNPSDKDLSTFSFPPITIAFFGRSTEDQIIAIGAYNLKEN